MNIEEAIKILRSTVEYDKKHRIITEYEQKPLLRDAIEAVLDSRDQLQKETEEYKAKLENERENCRKFYQEYIKPINDKYREKIKEKLKELEEQKEKLKYDGNVCPRDYEQFRENLKFFKEQIDELLEEK